MLIRLCAVELNEANLTLHKSDCIIFVSILLPLAAAYVSMYQARGVVGTILIGYLSDLFIRQVCSYHQCY